MPIVLEPYPTFKNGIHRAYEIRHDRMVEVRAALQLARSFGSPEDLVAYIQRCIPGSIMNARDFFESEDGYPHCGFLPEALIEVLKVGPDIGIGPMASGLASNLVIGEWLWDEDDALSPAWLASGPSLPFQFSRARDLLNVLDFEPDLDADAISDVQEAIDMGDLPLSGDDFLSVDAKDELEKQLGRRLVIYHDALHRIAARGGWVVSWYDRKTADHSI